MEEPTEKKSTFSMSEQPKMMGHPKNHSASVKIMAPKENEQEMPKISESLIRGGKKSLVDGKSCEKK